VFDLIIFRPLAFVFVKITFPFNFLTPNLVSIIAMLFGISAGILLGYGENGYLTLGAILYFLCNVLDCADGQIARLKHNGTKVGRIIDGFIDYVVSFAIFFGIAVGLSRGIDLHRISLWSNFLGMNPFAFVWILTVAAGISSALQAVYFDFYRNKFLEIVYSRFAPLEDEITEYEQELERVEREPDKSGFLDSFLIAIYLGYSRFQLAIRAKKREKKQNFKPNPRVYYLQNKLLLRLWSFIGSTTHITICVICALFDNLELFLILCILPLNLLLLVLYFAQSKVNTKLNYS